MWLARDENNDLYLFIGGKPEKVGNLWFNIDADFKRLGLNKNDYEKLYWKDEPVEVFVNMED